LPSIPENEPQFFRSIFLSDFHIGAKTFNANALLDFLRKTESQTLYLVGDIIDGWKLNKRWYWTEEVSQIFDELFRKAHEGTKIIYITGNHDETVRDISLLKRLRYAQRLNIQIRNRIVHRTAGGHTYLVLHGDQFDRAILRGAISRWGDRIYDFIAEKLHKKEPLQIEVDGKVKRFSLSKFLSYHGLMALNILNNFETALCREARRSDVEGIICGHTHIPALKQIGAVTYANCGSWLKESRTAIVETTGGRIKLIDWPFETKPSQSSLPFYVGDMKPAQAAAYRFRPLTERLTASIRRTWPSPHDSTLKEEKGFAQDRALSIR